MAWRPAVLDRVRAGASDGIRTVVIGPANLYGDDGGIPAMLAGGPITDEPDPALLMVGGDQHFPNVHRDDIAALYALAPTKQSRDRLGPLADAILLDARIDASHAHTLGWQPVGPSLLNELAQTGEPT